MKSSKISKVIAREVLDCKGKPAIEVDVYTESGILGRASAPSGVSYGKNEAYVMRGGPGNWYNGLGVEKAIRCVSTIIEPSIKGMDVHDMEKIDNRLIELDGTENKSKLGGNTIYSTSLACVKAAANSENLPLYKYLAPEGIQTLPLPAINCIDGGSYQKGTMPFQECTVVPYRANTIQEAVHIGWQIYWTVGDVIKDYQGGIPAKPGVLTGWQPPSKDPMACFDIIYEAVKRVGYEDKVAFAIDCASNEYHVKERGTYDFLDKELDLDSLINYVKELTEKYPFLYVEDVVQEEDWDGWVKASKALTKTILVGDDLTVTNIKFLKKAHELGVCSGFIFKPNQVGTVTEALAAHQYAKENGILTIPSIRAGGTMEDNVIDIGVAIGAAVTKQGPPKNGERIYGINFLLRAADENPDAKPFDFSPYIKF